MTDRASRWGLRALALAGALVLWYFASVANRERTSQKVVDAAVTYNLPAGTILLDPIQSVKVRVRGPDRQLRALSPFAVDVVVDVSQHSMDGVDVVHLDPSNVFLPNELDVVSIEPNNVSVRLELDVQRVLPIIPRIIGEPAGGAVPGDVRVSPQQAIVRGPENLLASLDSLTTSPVSLDGHAFTFSQTVSVVPPDPLIRIVQPGAVTVEVPMQNPDAGPLAEDPAAPGTDESD